MGTFTFAMKLKRFLLRYYPPGIILEYEQANELRNKSIDLLNLSAETDVELILDQIIQHEPLIKESRRSQLRKLIFKLIEKQELNEHQNFYLFKILRAHILPLTNCAFNKSGTGLSLAHTIGRARCGTPTPARRC